MNPVDLLVSIIREHSPEDIWRDSPLIQYRMLGNTNRGEIGEEFIHRYLLQKGIQTENGDRTSETDLRIGTLQFEVKTASLGLMEHSSSTMFDWIGSMIFYFA